MLSIGEIAHAAGVSRRMLRHWESIGLITPAEVDSLSGYRRYAATQVGRARAIAALRAVGFGLDTIRVLLEPELKQYRLVELLRAREDELLAEIDTASTRLRGVRSRLAGLQKGNDTMQNIRLGPITPLRLVGLQSRVTDSPRSAPPSPNCCHRSGNGPRSRSALTPGSCSPTTARRRMRLW